VCVIRVFSFSNMDITHTYIHLSKVLCFAKFIPAILLHLLKILQLLAVRVPEIVVQRLEEIVCIMEGSMVSVL
jgi:hypothetical protein